MTNKPSISFPKGEIKSDVFLLSGVEDLVHGMILEVFVKRYKDEFSTL
ncbi:hypothetical protein [Tepidibacter aestuarii]|nr:hypothetical protein [Tepidibacter aestuarii]CAH2213854.1 protein of unknown function [Tepidibacter aestuarii]